MFLNYVIHYPKPEKEALLVHAMQLFGEIVKSQPGIIFVNAFKDTEKGTVMAISIWETQEALQAALPAMREALKDVPFDEWEARPGELHTLNSLVY